MSKSRVMVVVLVWLVIWPVGLAWAQARAGGNAGGESGDVYAGSPLGWKVEPIIERYVKGMVRQYNLNSEQEEYTRRLMTRRVKDFLKEYEKDVRSLFAEYVYLQVNKEVPSPEMAKDWSRRATPLAAAIRKEIVDGNMEWRGVLNEDQRRLHDQDLDRMNGQFKRFDEQMERWAKGDPWRTDIFPGPQVSKSPFKLNKAEDAWEYRVRSFIQEYNLDAGQRQTAFSILRELRQEATVYRTKRQEEFAALEAKFEELTQSSPKTNPDELNKVRQERETLEKRWRELERPISEELLRQLLGRLDRIPTSEQRRVRDTHMARLKEFGGSRGGASGTTTRPAMTRPAEADTTRPAQPAAATRPVDTAKKP